MKALVRFTMSACLPCDVSPDDIIGTAEYIEWIQQTISQALHADVKIEACTVKVRERKNRPCAKGLQDIVARERF